MDEKGFKDYFSDAPDDYAASRPTYPPGLAAFLAERSPARTLALDCGCGNGQLSVALAEYFSQVIAIDASAGQIAAAAPHPRVTYRISLAEASGLADHSADLITAAQAAHWFDFDAFYREVRRAGKKGALLALVTYGVLQLDGEADLTVQEFYREKIGAYWPPERRYVEDGYRSLPFPFEELSVPDLLIERQWTRGQLLAHVETWSAVRAARKDGAGDVIAAFSDALAELWPDGAAVNVRWPVAVRAGRVE